MFRHYHRPPEISVLASAASLTLFRLPVDVVAKNQVALARFDTRVAPSVPVFRFESPLALHRVAIARFALATDAPADTSQILVEDPLAALRLGR